MGFSEWKKYKLSEVINIIGGGTPKTSIPEYWNGEIPWLSVVDFGGGNKYVLDTQKKITTAGLNNSSTRILKEGQLIISARGTVGEIAMLKKDMAFNQSCYGLDANENTSNNFLYYLIKQNLIELKSKTHGAVFDTITKETFNHIEISLPPLKTQERIASILSSLDDKIELNRQTNQTLETMAQTLFKEMCLPKGDVLEEGWRTEALDEVAEFLNGLALQKFPAKDEKDYLPVIKIRELKAGITNSTDKASRNVPTKYVIKNGDLLFSWSATLEVMFWCNGEGALNQHLFKVTSNKYPLWFCYMLITYHLQEFRKIASDKTTTMGHIQRKHLTEALCFIPSNFDAIDIIISPIVEIIKNNNYEIQTLTTLRDSLLPKLMKGEINITIENNSYA